MQSLRRTQNVLFLCACAWIHSWISEKIVAILHVQGTAIKLTIHGINSQEVVETQLVQLKLALVLYGRTDSSTLDVKPFVRKHLSVGNDIIDVDGMKQQYPHLELIPLQGYSYSNI